MSLKAAAKAVVKPFYKKAKYRLNRSLLQKNVKLKNKFKGQRIVILGDGRSLNDVDLSKLKNEYTFGSNFLMLHKDFESLDLSFYAIIATWKSAKNVKTAPTGTIEKGLVCLDKKVKNSQTQFFFDVSTKKVVARNQILTGKEIFYVTSGTGLNDAKFVEFDLSKPLSTLEGSLYFMIAAAMFMGFSEIYICGAGYTYYPLQSGHFYEDFEVLTHEPPDRRHVVIKEIADRNNVAIYNVTPDSFESPIYEKVSIKEFHTIMEST